MDRIWYLYDRDNGFQWDGISKDQLFEYIADCSDEDLKEWFVWHIDLENWIPIKECDELYFDKTLVIESNHLDLVEMTTVCEL